MGPFVDQVDTSENGLRLLSLWQVFKLSVANSFFEKTDHISFTRHHLAGKGEPRKDFAIAREVMQENSTSY